MSRSPMRRFMALAFCIAALSGCAAADLMKPGPAGDDPPAPVQESAVDGQQAALPTEEPLLIPPVPPGVKPMTPKSLVGLTPDEVRSLLGNPTQQRSDPPATVWTWKHGSCEVDVFFYLDLGSQAFRALTYEFRGAGQREAACLGALKEETDRGRRAQN